MLAYQLGTRLRSKTIDDFETPEERFGDILYYATLRVPILCLWTYALKLNIRLQFAMYGQQVKVSPLGQGASPNPPTSLNHRFGGHIRSDRPCQLQHLAWMHGAIIPHNRMTDVDLQGYAPWKILT